MLLFLDPNDETGFFLMKQFSEIFDLENRSLCQTTEWHRCVFLSISIHPIDTNVCIRSFVELSGSHETSLPLWFVWKVLRTCRSLVTQKWDFWTRTWIKSTGRHNRSCTLGAVVKSYGVCVTTSTVLYRTKLLDFFS
jgi:hypothetical protein